MRVVLWMATKYEMLSFFTKWIHDAVRHDYFLSMISISSSVCNSSKQYLNRVSSMQWIQFHEFNCINSLQEIQAEKRFDIFVSVWIRNNDSEITFQHWFRNNLKNEFALLICRSLVFMVWLKFSARVLSMRSNQICYFSVYRTLPSRTSEREAGAQL
jgi:hypothetical protein